MNEQEHTAAPDDDDEAINLDEFEWSELRRLASGLIAENASLKAALAARPAPISSHVLITREDGDPGGYVLDPVAVRVEEVRPKARSMAVAKLFGWASWYGSSARPEVLRCGPKNAKTAERRAGHPLYRVVELYERPFGASVIPEDVREGVAAVILDKVDIASFEDYGGGALCNAPTVASAVLSYLTSIGWGPKEG